MAWTKCIYHYVASFAEFYRSYDTCSCYWLMLCYITVWDDLGRNSFVCPWDRCYCVLCCVHRHQLTLGHRKVDVHNACTILHLSPCFSRWCGPSISRWGNPNIHISNTLVCKNINQMNLNPTDLPEIFLKWGIKSCHFETNVCYRNDKTV